VARYTAEGLTQMRADELERLVETVVIGSRPGILRKIHESWLRRYKYSGSYEGMGLLMERMRENGFSFAVTRLGEVQFYRDN
jgi:hypothetical protein